MMMEDLQSSSSSSRLRIIPAWMVLLMAGCSHIMTKFIIRSNGWSFEKQLKLEVITGVCYWLLLKYASYPETLTLHQTSIIPWWNLCYFLVLNTSWPKIIIPRRLNETRIIQLLRHGGPLGTNCSKLIETITGVILWIYFHNGQLPPIVIFGSNFIHNILYDKLLWCIVLLLCVGVNGVLYVWSTVMNSRGNHKGVNDMISSMTQNNRNFLSLKEQCYIFLLALINATVEEITSRFLWMYEFIQCFSIKNSDNKNAQAFYGNVLQATIFGISHYHGIPSGITGVLLTFVYGLIMGYLYQYNYSSGRNVLVVGGGDYDYDGGSSSGDYDYDGNDGGALFLPILVHTIADYYIFAIIARRKERKD